MFNHSAIRLTNLNPLIRYGWVIIALLILGGAYYLFWPETTPVMQDAIPEDMQAFIHQASDGPVLDIEVTFSEPIMAEMSQLAVFDEEKTLLGQSASLILPGDQPVDRLAVSVDNVYQPGTYFLEWYTVTSKNQLLSSGEIELIVMDNGEVMFDHEKQAFINVDNDWYGIFIASIAAAVLICMCLVFWKFQPRLA